MLLAKLRSSVPSVARNQRGMTLIEIMIVLAIMAAVMGGVMVSVRSGMNRTKISETRTLASNVMATIEMERIADPRAQPALEGLGLAESQTTDGWGNRFNIEYSGRAIKVISGGPDGAIGGPDDIVVSNQD